MKEQLVTLETAKLAKRKGFDWECNYAQFKTDEKPVDNLSSHNWNSYPNGYSIPTQSLLERWLREKHNIHCICKINCICCTFNNSKTLEFEYELWVRLYKKWSEYIEYFGHSSNEYEKALEECLQLALVLIENE